MTEKQYKLLILLAQIRLDEMLAEFDLDITVSQTAKEKNYADLRDYIQACEME